jgi:hypothetical protein
MVMVVTTSLDQEDPPYGHALAPHEYVPHDAGTPGIGARASNWLNLLLNQGPPTHTPSADWK